MEPGTIVEYIDQQKVICAVVLETSGERVRLLSEYNREVKHKTARLSHISGSRLKIGLGRDRLVEALKEISTRRKALSAHIDIREIWEPLHSIGDWIDLPTMTSFCFTGATTGDHESAVIRAFFDNRIYFKFNFDTFFPHSEEVVAQNIARKTEEERRERLIESGGDWLRALLNNERFSRPIDIDEITGILKSFYLYGKESPHYALGKAIMARSGADRPDAVFTALIRVGIWTPDENLDLYRYDIPMAFTPAVEKEAAEMVPLSVKIEDENQRVDLTDTPLITIDGFGTLDYDDALSIAAEGSLYRVGVHIADVGHYVEKGGVIDRETIRRGTSIYMPDLKIPMLPSRLAEDICSLRENEVRPAMSLFARVTKDAQVVDYSFTPSLIRVHRQLTYNEVNSSFDSDASLKMLYDIARGFNRQRVANNALQIRLPEISVRVHNGSEISVKKVDRESPGRILVSEMMIMANWLMARYLTDHDMPAIFRSQPQPKARLYSPMEEGTLFQNWMQRRLLSRVVLGPKAEPHSGLGLDAYTTATSPIRKYYDLVTQRQLRACFGMETPYSAADIEHIIAVLDEPLSHAALVQSRRHRYWIMKYLESKIGTRAEAIVLEKRRDGFMILITDYLVECMMSTPTGYDLKPRDLVQITFQHVDAARDRISVILG